MSWNVCVLWQNRSAEKGRNGYGSVRGDEDVDESSFDELD